MKKKLIIVDISNFIFRAFFAIRPMHTPSGVPVNAVYGVLSMLMKLINTYEPTHVVLARDTSGGSFRNEIYPDYKANRSAPPDDLIPQFGLINTLIEKMQIPNIAMSNFEADDIIGSLAVQFKNEFDEILIASGDKDLMQFVDEKVKMLDTMKEKIYGREDVYEKMGVYPEQIMDYLSLLGDSSDNIPGVAGIGEKGASKLLAEFENLDNILKNIDKISNKRAKTSLENGIEKAHISRRLVEIKTDLDLKLTPTQLQYAMEPNEELLSFLDELNFKTIKSKFKNNSSAIIESNNKNAFVKFDTIKDEKKWQSLLKSAHEYDQVFLDVIFQNGDYHSLEPVVFAMALGENNYVVYPDKISSFRDVMKDIFTINHLHIIATDLKPITCAAHALNIDLTQRLFDIAQAHFILDPDKKHDLATIALEILQENVLTESELLKEGLEHEQSVRNFEFAMAKRAFAGIRIYPWLLKKLKEQQVDDVFYNLDIPLVKILSQMEMDGITLDSNFYQTIENDFQAQVDEIEQKVKEKATTDINLKSPKQVGVLLFEKLNLPVIKKTKTGVSTDSSVLEELDHMGLSEIPGMILKFREIEKLLSTYVRVLPTLIDNQNKIHTHFNQSVAATGRLSSDNPNLQNIPIRSENGRRLRQGFIARPGCFLLGADYSQVELRILAHFSEDEVMLAAFKNDEDIHAQTAAEVFGIPLTKVTGDERSYAKAINFGLMYGQSSFGLSQTLGITRTEASNYITQYFTKFHKVKAYLDGLKEECEKTGYTSTLFGRKRILKDINSDNRQIKSMAERMAINTPIQGTAADIIKKAMIEIDLELKKLSLKTKMLLQVHDELIFEVPEDELEVLKTLVKEKMENAVSLKVPLRVDIGVGRNWYELK
jgi:DNA polymerase I